MQAKTIQCIQRWLAANRRQAQNRTLTADELKRRPTGDAYRDRLVAARINLRRTQE